MANDTPIPMTQIGHQNTGGATWCHAKRYPQYANRNIPWRALRIEARKAWSWVQQIDNAWTKNNGPGAACLVSAVFMPQPNGGVIFFSTICRGQKAEQMKKIENAKGWAPRWYENNWTNGIPPAQLHCEDGACYDFEKYNTLLGADQPAKIAVHNGYFVPRPGGTGPVLEMRIATFGVKYKGAGPVLAQGGPHLPCDDQDQNPKHPKCQYSLPKMRYRWWTRDRERLETEAEDQANKAGASGGAGGVGGASPGAAGPGYGGGYSGGGLAATGATDGDSHSVAGLAGMMTGLSIASDKNYWTLDKKGRYVHIHKDGSKTYRQEQGPAKPSSKSKSSKTTAPPPKPKKSSSMSGEAPTAPPADTDWISSPEHNDWFRYRNGQGEWYSEVYKATQHSNNSGSHGYGPVQVADHSKVSYSSYNTPH